MVRPSKPSAAIILRDASQEIKDLFINMCAARDQKLRELESKVADMKIQKPIHPYELERLQDSLKWALKHVAVTPAGDYELDVDTWNSNYREAKRLTEPY